MAKTLAAAVSDSPLIQLHVDVSAQLEAMQAEYQTRRTEQLRATEEYDNFVAGMEALQQTKTYLEAVPVVKATLPVVIIEPEPNAAVPAGRFTEGVPDVAQPNETPVQPTPTAASLARQRARRAR